MLALLNAAACCRIACKAQASLRFKKRQQAAALQSGFTLLELVLVMVLISAVMALAAPSLRGFISGRKSADAAAQILALAQYARTQAISTGALHRLNLDCAGRKYWLSVQKGAEFQPLGNDLGRQFSLPEGTSARWQPQAAQTGLIAAPAREYMDFYPDGRIQAENLQLTDAHGQVFELGCRSETEPLALLQPGGP